MSFKSRRGEEGVISFLSIPLCLVSILPFDLHLDHCLVPTELEPGKRERWEQERSQWAVLLGLSLGSQGHSALALLGAHAVFYPLFRDPLIQGPLSCPLASHSASPVSLWLSKFSPQRSSLVGFHNLPRVLFLLHNPILVHRKCHVSFATTNSRNVSHAQHSFLSTTARSACPHYLWLHGIVTRIMSAF